MKTKGITLLLIITSLVGYLEWGNNNRTFLFEIEYKLLTQLFVATKNMLHPFILIPILGQVLLLITLFERRPTKFFIYLGIACLGLLFGFMFFIGILSLNFKILLSTLPFLIAAGYGILYLRKRGQ